MASVTDPLLRLARVWRPACLLLLLVLATPAPADQRAFDEGLRAFELGRTLAESGDPRSADELSQAIRRMQVCVDGHFNRARALQVSGSARLIRGDEAARDLALARRELEESVALDRQPEALFELAQAHALTGARDLEIEGLTAALSLRPQWAECHFRLALALDLRGDPEGKRLAAEHAAAATKLDAKYESKFRDIWNNSGGFSQLGKVLGEILERSEEGTITPGARKSYEGVLGKLLAGSHVDPRMPELSSGFLGTRELDWLKSVQGAAEFERLRRYAQSPAGVAAVTRLSVAPQDATGLLQEAWALAHTDTGEGVIPRAAALYRQAADAGEPIAQWRLAELLLDGTGVTRDPVEAAWWLRLAAASLPAARLRLDDLMDASQPGAAEPQPGRSERSLTAVPSDIIDDLRATLEEPGTAVAIGPSTPGDVARIALEIERRTHLLTPPLCDWRLGQLMDGRLEIPADRTSAYALLEFRVALLAETVGPLARWLSQRPHLVLANARLSVEPAAWTVRRTLLGGPGPVERPVLLRVKLPLVRQPAREAESRAAAAHWGTEAAVAAQGPPPRVTPPIPPGGTLSERAERGDGAAQLELGLSLGGRGNLVEFPAAALAWLRRAARQDVPLAKVALAEIFSARGVRLREAEQLVEEAVARDPQQVQLHLGRSYVFLKQGRYQRAAEAARTGLVHDRGSAQLHENLAAACEVLGLQQEAADARRKAQVLRSSYGSKPPR